MHTVIPSKHTPLFEINVFTLGILVSMDGVMDGSTVGARVGDSDGVSVGVIVGDDVGTIVGIEDGNDVGIHEGDSEGD